MEIAEERKFIDEFLKSKNNNFEGWVCDDYSESWFYVKLNNGVSVLPSLEIIEIDNTLCAFNENGRAIDSFVSFASYIDENGTKVYLFNSYIDDLKKKSFLECLDLDDTYFYFNGKNGLAINKVVPIQLSDNFVYNYVTDDVGSYYQDYMLNNKLCLKGFIANEKMFSTPYKSFGTILLNKIPFLVSKNGDVLNFKKSVYANDGIYAYVNSDGTFFYSSNSNDNKWY